MSWSSTCAARPSFGTAHLDGATNVPLPLLREHARQVAAALDRPALLVCQSGARAEEAQRLLAGAGFERASVLDGGMTGYMEAGQAVVRGRARWSLDDTCTMGRVWSALPYNSGSAGPDPAEVLTRLSGAPPP